MIRYLTAGESHGEALVGIVEGLPAGLPVSSGQITAELRRRQQGYGRGARMRIETDAVHILSGVRHGRTIGSPVALMIRNADNTKWRESMSVDPVRTRIEKVIVPRAGHVDYAGSVKYGFDDIRNVIERASARETAMRVACCTLARMLLQQCGIRIGSYVVALGAVPASATGKAGTTASRLAGTTEGAWAVSVAADRSQVRMLSKSGEARAIASIKEARKRGDTLGGVFEVLATGLPIGLGSYVHHDRKLDGLLAQAMMSIQAIKGVEIGDGFRSASLPGSQVHDPFSTRSGRVRRSSNHAGGLEGGVTNGENLVLRAAMKPISTLAKPLASVNIATGKSSPGRYERSDVCAVPAASVIGEAVIAPVLANALLEKFGGDSVAELQKSLKRYRT